MKVALVAGRSGEALYNELLKREIEVHLLAGNNKDSGVDIAQYKFVCDFNEKEEIEKYLKNNNIKKIIVGTGHIKALELLEYLENKEYKISLDLQKLYLCKNKYNLKNELLKLGYNTPSYSLIKNDNKEIIFPCVLKSIVDRFTPNIVKDQKDLFKKMNKFQNIEEMMLEEYIEGNEISIPVTNDMENTKVLGIMNYSKGKDEKLEGFENLIVENLSKEEEEKVENIALNLIKSLKIYGLSRIDGIIKNKKFYILEINGVIVTGETNDDYTKIWKEKKMEFPKNLIDCALKVLSKKDNRIKKEDIIQN